MRNAIMAAAFAAALPASTMAQDFEAPQQAPETPDVACQQISATEQFCIALQNGQPQVMVIETDNGTILGVPGAKIDNEGNSERCLGIVDRQFNLRGLVCADDAQQNQIPAEPEFSL